MLKQFLEQAFGGTRRSNQAAKNEHVLNHMEYLSWERDVACPYGIDFVWGRGDKETLDRRFTVLKCIKSLRYDFPPLDQNPTIEGAPDEGNVISITFANPDDELGRKIMREVYSDLIAPYFKLLIDDGCEIVGFSISVDNPNKIGDRMPKGFRCRLFQYGEWNYYVYDPDLVCKVPKDKEFALGGEKWKPC